MEREAAAAQRERAQRFDHEQEAVQVRRKALREVTFSAAAPARGEMCAWCFERQRFRAATSWHHFLPQEQIRRYVDGLVRTMGKRELVRLLRRLLADERNLVALCFDCHDGHEHTISGRRGIEVVPASAFEFAGELGPEWVERLRRNYSGR
jgi:hypothetical protein